MMNSALKIFTCLLASALTLTACACHIPNQSYRSGDQMKNAQAPKLANAPVVVVEGPAKLPVEKSAKWPKHPEKECLVPGQKEKATGKDDQGEYTDLLHNPCLAFLEFDDFGETWQKTLPLPGEQGASKQSNLSSIGRPTQLDRIINLIVAAKRQDPHGEPLILTFVHGWKHNASLGKDSGDDDDNIAGVEATLLQLHAKEGKWHDHVVIGIYLAWRGGLISPYWPVSQQFTYWNREATAIRVGNSSMTDALIEISDAAKRTGDCRSSDACSPTANKLSSCPVAALQGSAGGEAMPALTGAAIAISSPSACSPLLLFVGHSFGALVLERAISQATITRMENEWKIEYEKQRVESETDRKTKREPFAIEPLADLVIYVDSAAAATESKQLMDYLSSSKFVYQPRQAGGSGEDTKTGSNEPLFLSVTSEADLATGLLLKVGHAVPWLGYKSRDSLRNSSAHAVAIEDTTQKAYPLSTTFYARACYEPSRDRAEVRTDLSQGDYFMNTTAHLQALWSHVVLQETEEKAVAEKEKNSCEKVYKSMEIGGKDYTVCDLRNRCNGTPYWAMQVNKDLIPNHTTIFTVNLIDFLSYFIQLPTKDGQTLPSRPQLKPSTAKAEE